MGKFFGSFISFILVFINIIVIDGLLVSFSFYRKQAMGLDGCLLFHKREAYMAMLYATLVLPYLSSPPIRLDTCDIFYSRMRNVFLYARYNVIYWCICAVLLPQPATAPSG